MEGKLNGCMRCLLCFLFNAKITHKPQKNVTGNLSMCFTKAKRTWSKITVLWDCSCAFCSMQQVKLIHEQKSNNNEHLTIYVARKEIKKMSKGKKHNSVLFWGMMVVMMVWGIVTFLEDISMKKTETSGEFARQLSWQGNHDVQFVFSVLLACGSGLISKTLISESGFCVVLMDEFPVVCPEYFRLSNSEKNNPKSNPPLSSFLLATRCQKAIQWNHTKVWSFIWSPDLASSWLFFPIAYLVDL